MLMTKLDCKLCELPDACGSRVHVFVCLYVRLLLIIFACVCVCQSRLIYLTNSKNLILRRCQQDLFLSVISHTPFPCLVLMSVKKQSTNKICVFLPSEEL